MTYAITASPVIALDTFIGAAEAEVKAKTSKRSTTPAKSQAKDKVSADEIKDAGLLDEAKAAAAADRRAERAAAAAANKGKDKTKAKTAKPPVKEAPAVAVAVEVVTEEVTAAPTPAPAPMNVKEIRPGVFLSVPTENTIAPAMKALPAAPVTEEKPKKKAKGEPKEKKAKVEKPEVEHIKMIRPSSAPSEKVALEDGKVKKMKLASYTIEPKEKVSAIAVDTKIFHIFTAMSVKGGATLQEISAACGVSMTESYTINRVTMRGYGVTKTTDEAGVNRFSLALPAGMATFRTR
jgi:hypothetical protein